VRYPFGGRVLRNCNVHGPTPIMRQNHENKQHPEKHGRDHEEVRRNQVTRVVRQKVRHVCEGGLRSRTMYFAIVDSASSNPGFKSSPWMCGAPQRGLARLILWIRAITSREIEGRPCVWLLLQFQYSRNPRRCQAITVSGLTITRADRQPFQSCESQAQKIRSATPSCTLWEHFER
jgi:hypothetical protein